MSTSKKPSLNDNPFVILISVLASIVAIFIFVTGVSNLPELLNPKKVDVQEELPRASTFGKTPEVANPQTSTSTNEDVSNEARFFYDLCKQYFLEENFERAIAECDRALILDSNYTPAYLLIASAYDTLGNTQAAEVNVSRAEAQDNSDPAVQDELDSVRKIISANIQKSFRMPG